MRRLSFCGSASNSDLPAIPVSGRVVAKPYMTRLSSSVRIAGHTPSIGRFQVEFTTSQRGILGCDISDIQAVYVTWPVPRHWSALTGDSRVLARLRWKSQIADARRTDFWRVEVD